MPINHQYNMPEDYNEWSLPQIPNLHPECSLEATLRSGGEYIRRREIMDGSVTMKCGLITSEEGVLTMEQLCHVFTPLHTSLSIPKYSRHLIGCRKFISKNVQEEVFI